MDKEQSKLGGNVKFFRSEKNDISNNYTELKKNISSAYDNLKTFNCSTNYIRTTTEKIPCTASLMKDSYIPLAITISPFSNFENEPPLTSFGNEEIPRCSLNSCRSYINPFVDWRDNGDRWVCNFCGMLNVSSKFYYDLVNSEEKRNSRPELCYGTYEFIASGQFRQKEPIHPLFIFVIDVSKAAVDSGFLVSVVESLKDIITNDYFQNPQRTKIAIITYDKTINFYSFGLGNPYHSQILCVSPEDIFLPCLSESLATNLGTSKKALISILDSINSSTSISTTIAETSYMVHAIKAAQLLATECNRGGKILCFNASSAIVNSKYLNNATNSQVKESEKSLTPSDGNILSNFGIELTQKNTSVDIFVTTKSYTNTITLNRICDYTNGNFYFYKYFHMNTHYKALYSQIYRSLSKFIAYEAVMRTRFSRGIRCTSYQTPVLISGDNLLNMPAVDSDQTYTFTFEVIETKSQDSLSESSVTTFPYGNYMYIQSACLYTHNDGTRRFRVHNMCLEYCKTVQEVYSGLNADVLYSYYIKSAIDQIFKNKKYPVNHLTSEVVYKSIISNSIKSSNTRTNQLIEPLSYLPLYMLGFLKQSLLLKELTLWNTLLIDQNNYLRSKILKLPVSDTMCFIYPRLYQISDLLQDESLGNYEDGVCKLPKILSLSKSQLQEDGLYLLDNGCELVFYIKKALNEILSVELFGDGVNAIHQIGYLSENSLYSNEDSQIQKRVVNVIDCIRNTKSYIQPIIFIFEGSKEENSFFEWLIEDNSFRGYEMDYLRFYKTTVEVNFGSTLNRPGFR